MDHGDPSGASVLSDTIPSPYKWTVVISGAWRLTKTPSCLGTRVEAAAPRTNGSWAAPPYFKHGRAGVGAIQTVGNTANSLASSCRRRRSPHQTNGGQSALGLPRGLGTSPSPHHPAVHRRTPAAGRSRGHFAGGARLFCNVGARSGRQGRPTSGPVSPCQTTTEENIFFY